jgi:hypothetical protein
VHTLYFGGIARHVKLKQNEGKKKLRADKLPKNHTEHHRSVKRLWLFSE